MSWYTVFKISIWYMIWYMFDILSVYENNQKIWLWLKMSDQILLILVYVQYTKNLVC